MTGRADRNLADEVARTLRGWLRDGTLERDRLYSVQQVAERLDVSRSPAREGVLALAEAGLVRFTRNRGFRVVVPTGRQVAEIFSIRMALEPTAAQQAARRATAEQVTRLRDRLATLASLAGVREFADADQELHAEILDIAGNATAARVVDELRDFTRTLGPSTMGRTRSLSDIATEHRPFVEAIAGGDAARARETMRHHLTTTGRLLIAQCAAAGDPNAWTAWEELVEEDL